MVHIWSRQTPDFGCNETLVVHRLEGGTCSAFAQSGAAPSPSCSLKGPEKFSSSEKPSGVGGSPLPSPSESATSMLPGLFHITEYVIN